MEQGSEIPTDLLWLTHVGDDTYMCGVVKQISFTFREGGMRCAIKMVICSAERLCGADEGEQICSKFREKSILSKLCTRNCV
jgi:hypothetical protein